MINRNQIHKIFFILPKGTIFGLLLMLITSLVMTVLEVFSVALIVPLLTTLVDSSKKDFILSYFIFLKKYNDTEILIIILSFFLLVFIFKNILLVLFNSIKSKFTYKIFNKITYRIYQNYLNKKYSFFIKKNSSEFIRNIISETNIFSLGVVSNLITLASDIIVVFCISSFLLLYNFKVSFFVIFFNFILGFLLLKFTNKKFKRWGYLRQKYSARIYKNLQESFGYLREIILSNSQSYFLKRHFNFNMESSNASIKRDIYSALPRPILETIALCIFYFLILILVYTNFDKSEILIFIGVIFFASIKLLPGINNIIKSLQAIKYGSSAIEIIYNELKNINEHRSEIDKKILNKNFSRIIFKHVSFIYEKSEKYIIKNLHFEIKRNDKVGIVGLSGSGKTTFLNLFTGLLSCTEGEITLDNKNIIDVFNQWKKNIGYVHQNTFLADEAILFNITLKKTLNDIEILRIWKILKIVEMDKYINSLELGLDTVIGERGCKLSGGQSQRLGLARVLYSNPSVIILDEATSALDEETQRKVLKSIYMMKNKTIISVSHRINALKYCNKIFSFKNGKLNRIK